MSLSTRPALRSSLLALVGLATGASGCGGDDAGKRYSILITSSDTGCAVDGGSGAGADPDPDPDPFENQPPEIASVTITPDPAITGDRLSCAYAGYTDPDGDPDRSRMTWTFEGAEVGTAADLGRVVKKGETYTCTVTASDGMADGNTLSATLTVDNTPPTAPGVTLGPTGALAGIDDLVCTVTSVSTDLDDDPITYTFTWTDASGTSVQTTSTIALVDTYAGSVTNVEDYTCTVTPNDGTVDGPSGFDTLDVGDCSVGLSSGGTTLSTDAVKFIGEEDSDQAGLPRYVGDLDGDGLEDIVIGAMGDSTNGSGSGAAYIVFGKAIPAGGTLDLRQASLKLVGTDAGDNFGRYHMGVGDVDGDGLDDLLVAARYNDDAGNNAGAVYLFLGATLSSASASSPLSAADADYTITGEMAGSDFGVQVDAAGDIDGDGRADLLVGALNGGTGQPGAAHVFLAASLGTPGTLDAADADYIIRGASTLEYMGRAVAGVGDVDGDGYDDILVGAYGNDTAGADAGGAFLFLGSTLLAATDPELVEADADHSFLGETAGDRAGISVDAAGDVDGDGLVDLLVGSSREATGGSRAGAGYLILGASPGSSTSLDLGSADFKFTAEAADDELQTVLSAGDVDGDGLDDLLFGSPTHDGAAGSNTGAAYLVYAASLDASTPVVSLASADLKVEGAAAEDRTGFWMGSGGDSDGDGRADPMICAYSEDNGHANNGAVYLMRTPRQVSSTTFSAAVYTAEDAAVQIYGTEAQEFSGVVAHVGDVNGDGLDDLVVGGRGQVDLFFGPNLPLVGELPTWRSDVTIEGDYAGRFGFAVSTAGDVDGDGLSDLLVSAYESTDFGTSGRSGAVYLYPGSTLSAGSPELTDADAAYIFHGNDGESVGISVDSAGDVDGDGLDDIVMGALYYGASDEGAAYVMLGSSLGVPATFDLSTDADYQIVGTGFREYVGRIVAGVGDVDGDGLDDVLVSAYHSDLAGTDAGVGMLFSGTSFGAVDVLDIDDADHLFIGEAPGDEFGKGLGPAGDVDGDGLADILFGSEDSDFNGSNSGSAYLFLASTIHSAQLHTASDADYIFRGEKGDDSAGFPVSTVGDIDLDGRDDILVGAWQYDSATTTDAGAAYIVYSSSLGSTQEVDLGAADLRFEGAGDNTFLGYPYMKGTGDLTGDGVPDVVLGSPYVDDLATDAGRVYLFRSPDACAP